MVAKQQSNKICSYNPQREQHPPLGLTLNSEECNFMTTNTSKVAIYIRK